MATFFLLVWVTTMHLSVFGGHMCTYSWKMFMHCEPATPFQCSKILTCYCLLYCFIALVMGFKASYYSIYLIRALVFVWAFVWFSQDFWEANISFRSSTFLWIIHLKLFYLTGIVCMYNRNHVLCFLINGWWQCLLCRLCYNHCPISPSSLSL